MKLNLFKNDKQNEGISTNLNIISLQNEAYNDKKNIVKCRNDYRNEIDSYQKLVLIQAE